MKKNAKIMIIAVAVIAFLAVTVFPVFGLGCMKANAETATDILAEFESIGQIQGTADTEVSLSLDADAIGEIAAMAGGNTNGMEQVLKPIASIISNLNARIPADSAQGLTQVDLKLKDTSLATFSGKTQEDGTVDLVTDLLDKYILKVDLAKLGAPETGSIKLTGEEQKAVIEAVKARTARFEEDIKAKMGEAENGTWEFDGAAFTEKKPVNTTTKEVTGMILNLVRDLYSDPAMKKVTDAMGDKFDIAKLDEAIAENEKKEDKDFPALTWVKYANAAGNEYNDISLAQDNKTVTAAFSLIGKKIAVHAVIDANGKGTVEGLIDAEALTANITADINASNIAAQVAINVACQKDGSYTAAVGLSMNDKQILGVNISAKASSETLDVSFDETDRKVVPVEALTDGSSAEGKELANSLTLALPAILQKAMQAMPDEVNALMVLFSGGTAK